MGRFASDAGSGFVPPPLGNHLAICYRVIDLGSQLNKFGTVQEKVMLQFELPNELMQDGRPFVISQTFTNSLNEKSNLRHALASWRTRDFTEQELKGFDLNTILGKPCMVSVVERDGKRNIGAISALPKGMSVPKLENEAFVFWIAEWDEETFQKLSQRTRDNIMKSPEYAERKRIGNGQTDNELPPVDEDESAKASADEEEIPF